MTRESVDAHSRVKVEEGLWDDFAEGIFYQPGEFADRSAYRDLAERLEQIDAARGTRGNRLFYLATPPSAYEEIVDEHRPRRAATSRASARAGRGSWSRSRSATTSNRRAS